MKIMTEFEKKLFYWVYRYTGKSVTELKKLFHRIKLSPNGKEIYFQRIRENVIWIREYIHGKFQESL